MYRALALSFPTEAQSGTVSVRLTGQSGAEAIVQAMEVLPGRIPGGRPPVLVARPPRATDNLLANGGFETTVGGTVGRLGDRVPFSGWTYVFASHRQSYIWAETDYVQHPHLGMPVIRSGKQALRTHTDGDGHTIVFQDVRVEPNTEYLAEAWIHAVDLHGKGFGSGPGDSAGLVIQELDGAGAVVAERPKAETRKAGPWLRVETRFRSTPNTTRARFILDTLQKAHYTEGHVTYDDCALRPADKR